MARWTLLASVPTTGTDAAVMETAITLALRRIGVELIDTHYEDLVTADDAQPPLGPDARGKLLSVAYKDPERYGDDLIVFHGLVVGWRYQRDQIDPQDAAIEIERGDGVTRMIPVKHIEQYEEVDA